MAQRKERNLIAKDLLTSKLYKPKVVPAKKGKGTKYKRKDRSNNKLERFYHIILLSFPV